MNRIRCAKCKDLLHSKHRHDWVMCSCGAVYVDGGNDYCRTGGYAKDIIMVRDDGTERPLVDILEESKNNVEVSKTDKHS